MWMPAHLAAGIEVSRPVRVDVAPDVISSVAASAHLSHRCLDTYPDLRDIRGRDLGQLPNIAKAHRTTTPG
jgi:hypothetical protein